MSVQQARACIETGDQVRYSSSWDAGYTRRGHPVVLRLIVMVAANIARKYARWRPKETPAWIFN